MGRPTGYDRLEAASAPSPGTGFELAPTELDPAQVVPPDLLHGPHHRVRSVRLDHRFLYTYVIESDYGDLEVVGRGLLRKRVMELEALAATEQGWLGHGRLYAFEVINHASEPIEGALQILRHPVRTVTNVPKSAKVSFLALREMRHMGRTHLEDDYYEEFMGLSARKREWAERLGVDPYSANPLVQSRLARNGWLSLAGDMTVSLATIPVPAGGASIAMSVLGATSGMNEQLRDVAPEDVRVTTRSFLRDELGVEGELATRFLEHPWYSPTRQDVMIRALARMEGAAHRDRFVELAARADEPHEAYAFTRLALMLAECHERRSPIAEIFVSHDLVMARTQGGDVVLPLYMDHGYWTAEVAQAEQEIAAALDEDPSTRGRLLLVSGAVSPRAGAELEGRGWELAQQLDGLWLTPLDLARYEPQVSDRGRILPELGRDPVERRYRGRIETLIADTPRLADPEASIRIDAADATLLDAAGPGFAEAAAAGRDPSAARRSELTTTPERPDRSLAY